MNSLTFGSTWLTSVNICARRSCYPVVSLNQAPCRFSLSTSQCTNLKQFPICRTKSECQLANIAGHKNNWKWKLFVLASLVTYLSLKYEITPVIRSETSDWTCSAVVFINHSGTLCSTPHVTQWPLTGILRCYIFIGQYFTLVLKLIFCFTVISADTTFRTIGEKEKELEI